MSNSTATKLLLGRPRDAARIAGEAVRLLLLLGERKKARPSPKEVGLAVLVMEKEKVVEKEKVELVCGSKRVIGRVYNNAPVLHVGVGDAVVSPTTPFLM